MRVLASAHRSEDGGSLVLVAASLLMLLAIGALAADAGSMWNTKRDIIADVDSAALAGARAAGNCDDGSGWSALSAGDSSYDAAVDLLTRNRGETPDSSSLLVERACDTGRAKVRVSYVDDATVVFAGALGYDSLQVDGSATAVMDGAGGGLRPFPVCVDDYPSPTDWTTGQELHVPYGNANHDSECGIRPGHWPLVCFDEEWDDEGTADCAVPGLRKLILEGYDRDVDLGVSYFDDPDNEDEDCRIGTPNDDRDPGDWCHVKTGATVGIEDALQRLECTEEDPSDCEYQFSILGFSDSRPVPGKPELRPAMFIGVVLRPPVQLNSTIGCDLDPRIQGCLKFEITGIVTSGSFQQSELAERRSRICDIDRVPDDEDRCGF